MVEVPTDKGSKLNLSRKVNEMKHKRFFVMRTPKTFLQKAPKTFLDIQEVNTKFWLAKTLSQLNIQRQI